MIISERADLVAWKASLSAVLSKTNMEVRDTVFHATGNDGLTDEIAAAVSIQVGEDLS